ncbi:hypothetical protein RJ640_006788 [Escallonia rubra]|uniref:Flavin-containing monooxygenase n=1 Tax=Escallonia rubra TaxID=112253 RepID=A0AA88UD53_9ASTE|nr:hypothetical protein RJ640_006788 [Escallonia rubra]
MSERQRLCFFINRLQELAATELRRREPRDLAFAMAIVERLEDFKQRERSRSPRHEHAKDGGDGPHYRRDCPHKGKMIAFLEKHKGSKRNSSNSDGEARIRALQMVNAFNKYITMARSLKVAVIGAGIAGLVAARELQREGHTVIVYEKGDELGGTWVYNPRVESDPLGLEPNREILHSSLYYSLRTNFSRHLMGFSDYPFAVRENGDSRNFPGHEEVLNFLNNFARDFELTELIRFNVEVVRVEMAGSRNDEWVVESRTGGLSSEDVFEAVVVCIGHHTVPRVADVPGIFS